MTRRDPPPTRANTAAVLVTYHPDDGVVERLLGIASQVDRVLVVDNGSNPDARDTLRQLARSTRGLELLENDDNLGVGAALNRGVERALSLGYDWIATFDQDSVPDEDMLARLRALYASYPHPERVKIIAANFVDGTGGPGVSFAERSRPWQEVSTVITSGALMARSGYEEVGPFREDFFIDSVDHEYGFRLRARGFVLLLSTEPMMRHGIGHARKYDAPWGKFVLLHHPPLRHYYITRNRLLTIREHGLREPRWALRALFYTAAEFATVPLFEESAPAKLRAMVVGLAHGLTGKSGKARGL